LLDIIFQEKNLAELGDSISEVVEANPGVRLRPLDPDVSETWNNLIRNHDIFSRESRK